MALAAHTYAASRSIFSIWVRVMFIKLIPREQIFFCVYNRSVVISQSALDAFSRLTVASAPLMPQTESKHYKGDAGRSYHYAKRGIPPESYDWVSRSRAKKIQPFIDKDNVVYELGVGSGWNLAKLICKRKLGLDVADFLENKVITQGIEFYNDYSKVPLKEVDVTLCHHVLEHLIDPAATLKKLHEGLRAGTKLLIYVPFEVGGRYRRFNPEEPNHHLFSWNVQTMGNLVGECGFKVENAALGQFGYDRFSAAWAVRSRTGENGFRALRRMLHLVLPLKEVRLVARR